MIARDGLLKSIKAALRRSPAVALLGPRQCGKTTLARMLVDPTAANYFDLEAPASLRRLENPHTALSALRGLIVIDEVQRRPELFPVLRVLIDRPRSAARFLLLGSASPALLKQSSESLAGRIEIIQATGFSADEVEDKNVDKLWSRGGFPRSYLAASEQASVIWRQQFIRSYIEQDIRQLGVRVPSPQLERFWTMLAHYHGQLWNAAEPAASLGLSQPTVRSYLDLMTSLYLVRQLQPWYENLAKRQVRAPKIYIRDSGLLHALLGVRTRTELLSHPKFGASWEGFIIEQLMNHYPADRAYFWRTHQGAELDLLIVRGAKRIGIEIKRADAPGMTRSIRTAMADLKLDRLWVIYPGETRYAIDKHVVAIPREEALELAARGKL